MRVIFSGGGTGGHIYPIMALIERLKEEGICQDDEILFVGTKKGLESKIVPAAGVNFKTIDIQGFDRKHLLNNVKTIQLFLKATKRAKEILADFQPDVVLGTGGYVSGAIVYEASKMKIPTMIHESNSVVGVANKFLGHYVDKICYTFDDAAKEFPEKKKLVKTGQPAFPDKVFELKMPSPVIWQATWALTQDSDCPWSSGVHGAPWHQPGSCSSL